MKKVRVNIDNLKTVKNYAALMKVAPTYVYRLIRDKLIIDVNIDGVSFVDILKYPTLPSKKS